MRESLKHGYAEPFIRATVETFKTMVHQDITEDGPDSGASESPDSEFSGIIGVMGQAQGSVTLRFPKPTAQAVANSFLGRQNTSNALVVDTIAELSNIITGCARKDFPDIEVDTSLPTVIVGSRCEITTRADGKKVVAAFHCPAGGFSLEVCLIGLPGGEQR